MGIRAVVQSLVGQTPRLHFDDRAGRAPIERVARGFAEPIRTLRINGQSALLPVGRSQVELFDLRIDVRAPRLAQGLVAPAANSVGRRKLAGVGRGRPERIQRMRVTRVVGPLRFGRTRLQELLAARGESLIRPRRGVGEQVIARLVERSDSHYGLARTICSAWGRDYPPAFSRRRWDVPMPRGDVKTLR